MKSIEDNYRKQFPTFDAFTNRLAELFETLMKNSKINYHLVESRTKSIESFCEKVNRKQGKYIEPLDEITDISALRVIVYYIDDLEKIEKLLRDNFIVDEKNSYHAKNNMTDNEFGYLSSHYVISLKSDRNKLPEWMPYKKIKAEIQVRTVLQHAWAAISHQLEYKKNYEIPSILKRKLFRLAGLIELADEEFQEAREKHREVEVAIKDNKSLNNQRIYEEINLNTIKNYFLNSPKLIASLDKDAAKAGFEIDNDDEDLQKDSNTYISQIIKICKIKGILTIADFDKTVNTLEKSSGKTFSAIYNIDKKSWIVSTEFAVLLLMITLLNENEIKQFGPSNWDENMLKPIVKLSKEK